MLFSSLVFLFAFLPLVLIIYSLINKWNTPKNVFLTFASLFFYAWGEPRFVVVMLLSIAANWLGALIVNRYRENKSMANVALSMTILFNVGLLFIFKYLNFFLRTLDSIFESAAIPQTSIVLPIGISFFTFQSMSYVIDVYRGHGQVQSSIMNVALYISLFPQLIAGPIVRYETVARQISSRYESLADFSSGVRRFVLGLGKKVILANSFAYVVDSVFDASSRSVLLAWVGAIAYTFQIYYDFSGYSDMAIGLGRLFGFRFDENFNYPYFSFSLTDFWKKWHISMSSWFRDYLYIPMGGSRVTSSKKLFINLMTVWFVTGLWHGANWTFIIWGLSYGLLIFFERNYIKPEYFTDYRKSIYRIIVLLIVVFEWVIFRSASLNYAIKYMGDMLNLSANSLVDLRSFVLLREYGIYFILGFVFSTPVIPWLKGQIVSIHIPGTNSILSIATILSYTALLLLCIAILVQSQYNPFIYFNF